MIRVNQVSKAFRDHQVLSNVNLQVARGRIAGLVGPNGAGKTTLIKIMMGILLPWRGRVLLSGHDVGANPGIKSSVGYVADYQSYYPGFRIRDMVRFYRESYPAWSDERFEELHRVFKLPADKKIRHLSKGMHTQLAMLLNLSIRPEVLVLDEPASGLDPVLRRQMLNILVDEAASHETTMFIASHNLSDLERMRPGGHYPQRPDSLR